MLEASERTRCRPKSSKDNPLERPRQQLVAPRSIKNKRINIIVRKHLFDNKKKGKIYGFKINVFLKYQLG